MLRSTQTLLFKRILRPNVLKTTGLSIASKPLRRFVQTSHNPISQQVHFNATASFPTAFEYKPIFHTPLSSERHRKTVVIIGGRSQLGKTVSEHCLASKMNVICTTQGSANKKLDERGYHWVGDVNLGKTEAHTKEYWITLLTELQKKHGKIHTLVNCAGISIDDTKAHFTMDDVNRKPVAPMLEACIELGISRFTYISSQAVKYAKATKEGSYSNTKERAEQDIVKVMKAYPGARTQTTIVRPDLIISADNPGHFGSPQRMSTIPFVKFTVGYDPRKAGNTLLQPVADHDVARAVVHISEYSIATPKPIDACGPEAITLEDLMSFFKKRQHKRFAIGWKIPSAAIFPAARIRPWGAFEEDHFALIKHHEEFPIGQIDTSEFERIVAYNSDKNNSPTFNGVLLTLDEIFDFTRRPVFGMHNLGLYSKFMFEQVTVKDLPSLFKGICIGLTQSRIDFFPHKKTAERRSNDGVNAGAIFGSLVCTAFAASFFKNAKDKETIEPSSTKSAIEFTTLSPG